MYSIDLQPWELRHGSRWQVWPDGVPQPWPCALKRLMGSPAAAPVVVRELWHARGELFGDDLEGLVSVLPLGGSAVLHAVGAAVHLPRATAVTLASHVPAVRVPAAMAVKWRGQVETRVRTLLVTTAREGRRWGDVAKYAEVPVPAQGDNSDEGLPADDLSELDGSAGDASSDGGWSSDSDEGRAPTDEDPTTFVLRMGTLNVCCYQRKKTEVLATALRHKVDVLALTEARSRTQGRVEGEDYDLWELGANRAEGKALLVHTGSQISVELEAVTEDVFVVTLRYREKDLIRVGVVYATPDRPEREGVRTSTRWGMPCIPTFSACLGTSGAAVRLC